MLYPDARILVFAKAPIPGQVKTRLSSRYGARSAAQIHKQLVHNTLAMLTDAKLCPIELWCAPDTRHGFFHGCRRRYGVRLQRQSRGDLGQRMHRALQATLKQRSSAVLIGSDCVSLDQQQMQTALNALTTTHDAVIGPSRDGGYLLIGLNRPCPTLFTGMRWSQPSVLAATRQRLRRARLDWLELPSGWDVDYPADVRRWRRTQTVATTNSPTNSA